MSNTYTGVVRTYNGTILREEYFQLNGIYTIILLYIKLTKYNPSCPSLI